MDPFLGEIRLFSFNFPPKNWALCNGQILPINQNSALFSLLGTTYGGNGSTTFALPDFRGRLPVHGPSTLGAVGGQEAVTLSQAQMAAHNHAVRVVAAASGASPTGNMLATAGFALYDATPPNAQFDPAAVLTTGGSQPHDNMQPYIALSFCIALQGIFPSRN